MILMCLGGQNSKGERFKGFAKQSISKSDTLLVAEAFQAHLAVVGGGQVHVLTAVGAAQRMVAL